jgi:hypothetical protein
MSSSRSRTTPTHDSSGQTALGTGSMWFSSARTSTTVPTGQPGGSDQSTVATCPLGYSRYSRRPSSDTARTRALSLRAPSSSYMRSHCKTSICPLIACRSREDNNSGSLEVDGHAGSDAGRPASSRSESADLDMSEPAID